MVDYNYKFKKGDKVIILPEYRHYPQSFMKTDEDGVATGEKILLDPEQTFVVEIADKYTCFITTRNGGCYHEFDVKKLWPASRAAKLLFF